MNNKHLSMEEIERNINKMISTVRTLAASEAAQYILSENAAFLKSALLEAFDQEEELPLRCIRIGGM